MTVCLARADRFGTMRCIACRVSWDSDDLAACPREAPPIAHQEAPLRCTNMADAMGLFVSGLAPDRLTTINR
jgi:hypothetical protein